MTTIEKKAPAGGMGRLLSECFAGGEICRRELRLSREQAGQVARDYPASQVRPMGDSWYEITFQGALSYEH